MILESGFLNLSCQIIEISSILARERKATFTFVMDWTLHLVGKISSWACYIVEYFSVKF